jgi:hypothetical protein
LSALDADGAVIEFFAVGTAIVASVRFDPMRLVATDTAVDFIQEHGGRHYIWMKRNRCCGGSYSTAHPPCVRGALAWPP